MNNAEIQHVSPTKRIAWVMATRIVSLCLLFWGVVFSALSWIDYRQVNQTLDADVKSVIAIHGHIIELSLYDFDNKKLEQIATDLLAYPFVYRVEIFSEKDLIANAERKQNAADDMPAFTGFRRYVISEKLHFHQSSSAPLEIGLLRLSFDNRTRLKAFYSRSLNLFLGGIALMTLIALAIFFFVQRFLTGPINRLARELTQVDILNLTSLNLALPRTIRGTELDSVIRSTQNVIDAAHQAVVNFEMVEAALNSANEHLEDKIKERTESLTEANNALTQSYERLNETRAKLFEADKLAAIGRLGAGVAHEINNPLAIVRGNLSALRTYNHDMIELITRYSQCVAGGDLSKLDEVYQFEQQLGMDFVVSDSMNLLRDMEDAVMRVSGIVKDLKAYSRSDVAEVENVSLDACVQQIVGVTQQIEHTSTQWLVELGETRKVRCHVAQINEMLSQVIRNALQAVATVSDPCISINTVELDDCVAIIVRDNGSGISDEALNSAFDPFFTTREVGSGKGLGLTRARSVVEAHGGSITLGRNESRGCFVKIIIPFKTAIE